MNPGYGLGIVCAPFISAILLGLHHTGRRPLPLRPHPQPEHPMTKKTGRRISGDPRKTGGDITGPGGPRDRNAVIIDPTNAILLDHSTVTLVEASNHTAPVLAMLLEGRINKTPERARNLYLMNEDGAAARVSELIALAHRIGPEFGERLMQRISSLIEQDAVGGEQR